MLGTSKKQQNLAKNGLEAALGNKTPFRRHFASQGAAKSSQKDAKLAAKGSQDGAKWHLKCNAYLYAIFEHIWDPPGRSDSRLKVPPPSPYLDLLDRVKPICFKPRLKPILNNQNQRNSNKSG